MYKILIKYGFYLFQNFKKFRGIEDYKYDLLV